MTFAAPFATLTAFRIASQRLAQLLAALGVLEIAWRGFTPDPAGALQWWLHSPTGIGDVSSACRRRASTSR